MKAFCKRQMEKDLEACMVSAKDIGGNVLIDQTRAIGAGSPGQDM